METIDVHNLCEIMDLVQCSSACHVKYAALLKKASINSEDDELVQKLYGCLRWAFLTSHTERNPFVARVVDFVALFAATFKVPRNGCKEENQEIHPIIRELLSFILDLSYSAVDAHRYWSCTLFNKIFQNMEELPEDLCEEVQDSMLERLRDPKAVIRCQAIIALHRLQNPSDDDDLIIAEMCNILNSDYNAKVRQLCLEKIALNKSILKVVLKRITDVDANVRLAALKKVTPTAKYLRVAQKRSILQCGFYDAVEKIRVFTRTELVQTWLQTYNNDYIQLLKSLRLDACEEDIQMTAHLAQLVLQALFKGAPIEGIVKCLNINENKLINYEDLNWDSVLYCRICVQFLRQTDALEDNLDQILPELITFCKYIKSYCLFMKNNDNFDELEYQFILQQLFLITRDHDVSDAVSRQRLNSLVHHMLTAEDISVTTAEIVISNLEKTIANVSDRSIFLCEMISNILHGEGSIDYEEMARKELERSHSISQLQSDIHSLQDQENHFAFVEKNIEEAARVNREITTKKSRLEELRNVPEKLEQQAERKTDVATMLRVLSIAEGLLLSPTVTFFNPAISTLHSEIISPALMHNDKAVVSEALKCYALCCVIDKTTARYGIHIFSGILFSDDAGVKELLTSLSVIVDMISIYGLSLIQKRDDEDGEAFDSINEEGKKVFYGGTSLTDLLQALADHLEHEDPQVQSAATRGVCILLLNRRITSPSLLSRIIIKWANPTTEDTKLKQFIGKSLSELVKLDNCHTYFGDAVIETMKTLVYAPNRSPLAEIDVDNVVKFMTTLCQMPAQGASIQRNLALKMCDFILEHPNRKLSFFFSKALLLLNLPEGDSRDELLAKCDDLKDVVKDTRTLRNINKFNTKLAKKSEQLVPIQEVPDGDES